MSFHSQPKRDVFATMFDDFGEADPRYLQLKEKIEKEVHDGKKEAHWIWYMYPQLKSEARGHTYEFEDSEKEDLSNLFEKDRYKKLFRLVNTTTGADGVLQVRSLSPFFPEIDHDRINAFRARYNLQDPGDMPTLSAEPDLVTFSPGRGDTPGGSTTPFNPFGTARGETPRPASTTGFRENPADVSSIMVNHRIPRAASYFFTMDTFNGRSEPICRTDVDGNRLPLTAEHKNAIALDFLDEGKPVPRRYLETNADGLTFAEEFVYQTLPPDHTKRRAQMSAVNAYIRPEEYAKLVEYFQMERTMDSLMTAVAERRGMAGPKELLISFRQNFVGPQQFDPVLTADEKILKTELTGITRLEDQTKRRRRLELGESIPTPDPAKADPVDNPAGTELAPAPEAAKLILIAVNSYTGVEGYPKFNTNDNVEFIEVHADKKYFKGKNTMTGEVGLFLVNSFYRKQ